MDYALAIFRNGISAHCADIECDLFPYGGPIEVACSLGYIPPDIKNVISLGITRDKPYPGYKVVYKHIWNKIKSDGYGFCSILGSLGGHTTVLWFDQSTYTIYHYDPLMIRAARGVANILKQMCPKWNRS